MERVHQLSRESTVLLEEENQLELAWEKLRDKTGPRAKSLEDARNEIKKHKARMHEDSLAALRFAEFNLWIINQLPKVVIFGISLAAFGFCLWYWKVQRYLDYQALL
jgi:hypothetical protein